MNFLKVILVVVLGFYAGYSFGENASETKEAIQKDLEQGIEKLRIELKDLQVKAENATGKAKTEINQQIDELKQQENKMHQQVAHVKGASGKAWEDIKKGAQDALSSLKKSMNNAKERFK